MGLPDPQRRLAAGDPRGDGSDVAWPLNAPASARSSAWGATSAGMGSATGPAAAALNTWTHLAATYDGASLRVFVNGAQVAGAPRTGALAASGGPLRLGGNGIWSECFAGRLDDVRIHNRAPTPAQITTDNGTQAGTRSLTGNLRTSTGAQRIGGDNIWSEWFAGLTDEIRIYNRAVAAPRSTPT